MNEDGAAEPARTSGCPACGEPVAAGARFCASCGAALTPASSSPATPAGERRRLTIMFCDLVGSTALSEQLDPEDLGELVLAYQEMGRATVQRLGGHVAQYLGDGLLAYFGYPIAHEDDGDRAVLAGLAVLEGLAALNETWMTSLGVRLDARVGIHAGSTIVGAMGSADRSDTSAFGSTPNIAARLEGFARPGTVVVSDEVRHGVSARFAFADLGTPELKGISRPVRAWEVVEAGDLGGRTGVASPTPVIGRETEQRALTEVLDQARAGRGQTVVLTGEPGIGKSRLVQGLYEQVAPIPHVWLEGQCSELAAASTLAPVVELLRRSLDLDAAAESSDDWERLVAALAPLGEVATSTTLYLADLLDVTPPGHPIVDEGPELRRRRTLHALVDWTRLLGKTELAIVVLEDLHWGDPTTLELVTLLTRSVADRHVLCVLTTRPGTSYDWQGHDGVTTLPLSPLGALEAEELTRALGADHGLTGAELDAVVDRSDGVPLFIEALVNAAAEPVGARDDGEIPRTLQALLAAQLDRLGPVRGVAQAASVLGREFPMPLLASVAPMAGAELDDAVQVLRAAGLLDTRNTPTGTTGLFRHALIQDAAYSSILRRERRRLHGAVAGALSSMFPARVERSPELLAHHLEGAGQGLEAATCYERAGRQAAERAALAEARTHLQQGLVALDTAEASSERDARLLSLNILLGNVLMGSAGLSSDEALPVWEAAIAAAERLEDHDELTSALNGAAVFHADRADTATAIELAERILTVAEATGSRVASLRAHGTLGMIRFYQGDGPRALQHLDTAMAQARVGDFFSVTYGIGHDEETTFHMLTSWVQWWLGHPDRALEVARRGLDIALRIPSSLSQAMARHALATVHHSRGERDEAERVAGENLALCTDLGFPFWGGLAATVVGAQRAARGEVAGLDQLTAGLDRLAAIGNLGGAAFGMVFLAEANLGLGRHQAAVDSADLGLATGEMLGQPFYEPELLRLKALGLAGLERPEEARVLLDESVRVAERLGAASIRLRAAVSLGRAVGGDEPRRSAEVLEGALSAMGDGADTDDQRQAHDLLDRLRVTG